jgi:methionine synthase II (cobalamin-independent)
VTAGAAPTGVATAIGSLPGEDIDAAVALVFEALPDLPHLPELPARGPGADMIGRTAAGLADLHVDLQPAGWRLVPRPGLEERRATGLLERDLDALTPVAPGYAGAFKVQLAGPWTLAAALELPRGGKTVGDPGAVRDIVDALAETVRNHLGDVARRLPGARLVLQLDEPSLPAVLAGAVPTDSGMGRLRAVDAAAAEASLRRVVEAAGGPVVVHCCGAGVPFGLLHDAGAAAVSFDLGATAGAGRLDLDDLGERIERGLGLWLGVVPALGPGVPPTVRDVLAPVRDLWNRFGFGADRLGDTVVLTPTCGLAGASDGWARTALRLVAQSARTLAEAPEDIRA